MISVVGTKVKHSGGAGDNSVNVDPSVNTDNRVVVCVAVNDHLNGGITDITVTHDAVSNIMTFTRVDTTTIIGQVGGDFRNEVWISTPLTGPSGSQNINVDIISSSTEHRISAIAMVIDGLNTDDGLVINDFAVLSSAIPVTTLTSGSVTTTEKEAILVGFLGWDENNNIRNSAISNSFTILEEDASSGTGSNNEHVSTLLASRIMSSTITTDTDFTITNSANYAGYCVAFLGAIETEKAHTSDTLLNTIADQQHTSDILLNVVIELPHTSDVLLAELNDRSHSLDVLLRTTVNTQHTTDMFIEPPERTPELRPASISDIPNSSITGDFKIKVLSVHGNALSSQNFNYTQPTQEFTIGKTNVTQISIVDPIIKKDVDN